MTNEQALTIPQRADLLAFIDRNPELADRTKAKYKKALTNYLDAGHGLDDADALADYALTLSPSSRAFLKAAVRLWTRAMEQEVKANVTPDKVDDAQAIIMRLEAINEAIHVKQAKGEKSHIWLSKAEVKRLLDTCEESIRGQRDRLLLGLLVAAGLRREEAAALRFDDVKLKPVRGKFRTVLAIEGKGAKGREVPISDALANALDAWAQKVGGDGHVLRSLGMGRRPGKSLSAVSIFNIVRQRGGLIDKDLAPHDLRRTYAQIGFEEGVPITQLSKLLGHANVATTQRYLNLDLDLEVTVSDFVPF
jgi:integrase